MRDIKAHTGMRGIAATTVFLAHAQFDQLWHGAVWLTGIYSFFYWQNPAVDLFFMLSGFILNYVYCKQRHPRWLSFFSARFARICPLYYAGFFVVLAMNLLAFRAGSLANPDLNPAVLLPNLAMLQEWPVIGHVTSVNIPSWSISVELFLYVAIFPLLAFLFARRSLPRAIALLLLILALLINAALNNDSPYPLNFQSAPLIRGITGFAAGFLICDLVYKSDTPLVSAPVEITLAILALALLPFIFLHLLLPFIFAALIAVTYSPASRVGKVLGSPFLVYLGGISYSIYIWQYPVIKACTVAFSVRRMGGVALDPGATLAHRLLYCFGAIATLAAVANISYYLFENPLRHFIRRATSRWTDNKRSGNPIPSH